VLLIALPLLSEPLSRLLNVPRLLMPFIILLIWLPFLVFEGVRRWRTVELERQALQAKFDAQDKELFGDNACLRP
jgi:uncharacterized SAM-binding protein YcdF (DUF218 family)